jgi:hypothetical protein
VFSNWWWDVEDDFERRAREEPNEPGTGMDRSWGVLSLAFGIGFEDYEVLEGEGKEYEDERRSQETIDSVSSWLMEESGEMRDVPREGVSEDEEWDLLSTGFNDVSGTDAFSDWEEVLEE